MPSPFALPASEESSAQKDEINLGYTATAFSGVNKNDADAAIKLWVEMLAKNRGLVADINTVIFEDIATLRTALQAKEIDIMIFLASDYLELEGQHNLIPTFVPLRGPTPEDRSLLLVRKDSGMTGVTQLKGKSLIVHQASGAGLGHIWLDTLLLENSGLNKARFFSDIRESHKISTAVLHVFFKKITACLVSERDYMTMTELNPQLDAELSQLAASQSYVPSVVCVREDYGEHRNDLVEGLAELHQEPRGQQILSFFKVDRLIPYDPSQMDAARAILSRHETVKGQLADSGP